MYDSSRYNCVRRIRIRMVKVYTCKRCNETITTTIIMDLVKHLADNHQIVKLPSKAIQEDYTIIQYGKYRNDA
jgi:hypothetical protein